MWKHLRCLCLPEIEVKRTAGGGFPVLCPQLPSVPFPTGLVDSGVTQMPKYLIKSRKQQGTLRCSLESGHRYVSWYQQALGQSPQFLVQYFNREVNEKGNMPDLFSGEQFSDSCSQMNLSSLELTDSAVYLCASSQDTALHDQVPLGQKHSCPSSGSGCRVWTASQRDPGTGRVDSISQTFFLICFNAHKDFAR